MNNKKWSKWCMFVTPFLTNNIYGLPVLSTYTKRQNQVFYFWLVDLQTICAKVGLETWFYPNENIRKHLLDMKHGSTKIRVLSLE
jgi:cytochrome bd-type quinol oxidase subunit 2